MKLFGSKHGKYEGRHTSPRRRKRRTKALLPLCLVLILGVCLTVGGTLAFMQQKTDTVTNTFKAGDITYTLNLEANAANVEMPSELTAQSSTSLSATFTPDKAPTKTGYTFGGWYYDTACTDANLHTAAPGTSITVKYGDPYDSNPDANKVTITLYAQWYANTNTEYRVEHYQQNVTGNDYTIVSADTQYLTGTTDTQVTPAVKNYTGFKSPEPQTVTIAGDGSTVVKYYYDRLTYTVTLNKGTGIASVSGAGTYRYGASVTINATADSGYNWSKWSGTHDTTAQQYTFTMPNGDVNDTANAEIINYTISYNLDGGSVSGNPTSYNVTTANFTLKNPTRTGYTFAGWTGSNGNTKQTTVTIAKGSTGNKSYTANWTENSYTIKYNANGGSGSMSNTSAKYATAVTLRTNTFTRTGYTFQGWATSANGSKVYNDKQSVSKLTATNGGTVNLYAVWKANTYTITYHANGATSGSTAKSTHTYNTAKTLTANGFKWSGYQFLGWSTSAKPLASGATARSYVQYANGQSVNNLTSTNGGNINLYAVWTYSTLDIASLTTDPDGNGTDYLWQEHPCSSVDGGHYFDLGNNKIYRYNLNRTYDVSETAYFHFDIKVPTSATSIFSNEFKTLMTMNGQIEFGSSGKADENEKSIEWKNVLNHAYYTNGGNGWVNVYVPLSAFVSLGNPDLTKINFLGVYWANNSNNAVYSGQLANPYFTCTLPAGAGLLKNSLSLNPEEPVQIDLLWEGIDDTNMDIWYPVDEQYPTAGDSYELAFEPAEGYAMAETITVTIDDVTYEVYTNGQAEDGVIAPVYDPEANVLSIPAELLTAETTYVSVTASAVPVEIIITTEQTETTETESGETEVTESETAAEEATITVAMNLTNMTAQGDTTLQVGEDYTIVLVPDEGYQLPEIIRVEIDGTLYEVYTDGLEHRELPEGESELPPMPTFDPATGTLTIPAILLGETTQNVTITISAVEIAANETEASEVATEEETEKSTDESELATVSSGDAALPPDNKEEGTADGEAPVDPDGGEDGTDSDSANSTTETTEGSSEEVAE